MSFPDFRYVDVASITVQIDPADAMVGDESDWDEQMFSVLADVAETRLAQELNAVVWQRLGTDFAVTRIVPRRGSVLLTIIISVAAVYHAIGTYGSFRSGVDHLRRDIPALLSRILPRWVGPVRVSQASTTVLPAAASMLPPSTTIGTMPHQQLMVPFLMLLTLILLGAVLAAAVALFIEVV
jgi:hypothetical protein